MDYVLFGIQGAGKGTQAKFLCERLKAAYFETGGQLRAVSSEPTELGEKIKSIIDAGHLVPNEVVMEMAGAFISKHTNEPIVFDGVPRKKKQDETLQALFKKMGREYRGIYFELSRDISEKRLLGRRICSKCKTVYPASYKAAVCEKCGGALVTRADDTDEAIRRRIDIFFEETVPVIEEWRKNGQLISVNARGSIQEVRTELFARLKI